MGVAGVTAAELVEVSREFRELLRAVDTAVLDGADCATVVEELAALEKTCAAARARAATRAADCGAHRAKGYADPSDWLAKAMGSSTGAAKATFDTMAGLGACPTAAAALAAGKLSLDQAREIAKTEAEAPGSEADMVAKAASSGLGGLKDEGRKRRAAAISASELHRRQRQARRFRHWRDELGMVCFSGALTPEAGVAFVNRLEAEADRLWRALPADERRTERHERVAADAFLRLTEGGGKATAGRTDLVIVCDLSAWRRGHAHAGEACHVVGGGPIPVDLAKQLGRDAFLKTVLHDGVAVHTVKHFGRHLKAEVRTALELGAPPEFDGVRCSDEGCDRRHGLEWDHVDPVANGGPTSIANLDPKCRPSHRAKTERDRAAGLLGGGAGDRGPP